jgi:hypothetical protein
MKRVNELSQQLWNAVLQLESVEETFAVYEKNRQSLQRIYAEKAWHVTERFFTVGEDVFREGVLQLLARTCPYTAMCLLRSVCKRWLTWLSGVRHLNFAHGWDGCMYHHCASLLGEKYFPCVLSLIAWPSILQQRCEHFSRIESLELLEMSGFSTQPPEHGTVDMLQWSRLTRLIATQCEYPLCGIERLTSLCVLSVCDAAFICEDTGEQYQLTQLINLRVLAVRQFDRMLDLSPLTALTSLCSDQPRHFAHFTGSGVLTSDLNDMAINRAVSDDSSDTDRSEEDEMRAQVLSEVRADFAVFLPDCDAVLLDGSWVNGAFTGDAFLRWRTEVEHTFYGKMLNGKREGEGREIDHAANTVFIGTWHSGVRHGSGTLHNWNTRNDTAESLICNQIWEYGRLACGGLS